MNTHKKIVIPIADYVLEKHKRNTPTIFHGIKEVVAGCQVHASRFQCQYHHIHNKLKENYIIDIHTQLWDMFFVFIRLPNDDKFYKVVYNSFKNPYERIIHKQCKKNCNPDFTCWHKEIHQELSDKWTHKDESCNKCYYMNESGCEEVFLYGSLNNIDEWLVGIRIKM